MRTSPFFCADFKQNRLRPSPVGARMHQEGLLHGGVDMLFKGQRHRIDTQRLTGGKNVMVYGQTELTRHLMQGRQAAGLHTICAPAT